MSYLNRIKKLMVVGGKKETDPSLKAGKAKKTAASIAVTELLDKYYSNR